MWFSMVNNTNTVINTEQKNNNIINKKLDIIVDTREQDPLWIKGTNNTNIIVKKLNVGDYSVEGFEDLFCIERKSPMDAFGTITKGHVRFNKELERAKNLKYFAVVIEIGLISFINKDFPNSFRTKSKGHQVFQAWITSSLRYGYPVFFTNSKAEAKTLVRSLLKTCVNEYT
jgi:ERCC4-type nuclease